MITSANEAIRRIEQAEEAKRAIGRKYFNTNLKKIEAMANAQIAKSIKEGKREFYLEIPDSWRDIDPLIVSSFRDMLSDHFAKYGYFLENQVPSYYGNTKLYFAMSGIYQSPQQIYRDNVLGHQTETPPSSKLGDVE